MSTLLFTLICQYGGGGTCSWLEINEKKGRKEKEAKEKNGRKE
jgi:hypothetical protein